MAGRVEKTSRQENRKRPVFGMPAPSPLGLREKLRAGISAGLAIVFTALIASQFLDAAEIGILIPSMGASAVILFAVPHSPMAGSWALVGGHFISALIGILCRQWISDLGEAAALAVGLSIFAMHLARCLHPPGGASALIPVLGGENIQSLGFQFLLTPLALNLAVMFAASLIYKRFFLPRPALAAKPADERVPTPLERLGIQTEDLRAALRDMNEFVDVGERELNEIYNLAATRAFRREFGEITAAHVMTRDPYAVEFGTGLEEAWALMRKHRIKALPVIDRGHFVIGIVTLSDFFRHAQAEQFSHFGNKLRELIRQSPTVSSQKPEVAGQIMSAPVLTSRDNLHIAELARLLTERGVHQLPIVDERNKLVGLVTQTDLIAALFRSMTAAAEKPDRP